MSVGWPNLPRIRHESGTAKSHSKILLLQLLIIFYLSAWLVAFSKVKVALDLSRRTNLQELSAKYELSGASILNAVHFAVLQCYSRNDDTLYQKDLIEGVRKNSLKKKSRLR